MGCKGSEFEYLGPASTRLAPQALVCVWLSAVLSGASGLKLSQVNCTGGRALTGTCLFLGSSQVVLSTEPTRIPPPHAQ